MANKSPEQNPVETMMLGVIPVMVSILSGDIWSEDEAAIASAQQNLAAVLSGLKNVGKAFDEALVAQRKSNPDALKSVEHFRKPRESKDKGTTDLVDLFKVNK